MVASYSPHRIRPSAVLEKIATALSSPATHLYRTYFVNRKSYQACSETTPLLKRQALTDRLASLSGHTFGNQWLKFSQDGTSIPIMPPQQQLVNSLHVLTGYEADVTGNAELQAFLLGATGHFTAPYHWVRALNSLCHVIASHPSLLLSEAKASRLYQAYQRGQASYFELKNWHPEQLLDLPLPYVRKWFGITEKV